MATFSSIPALPPPVPKIREAIAAVSKDAADALINTHWHYDHTDGNEGMHAAGFTIFAHRNTRERLSTPQTMKFFHMTFPPLRWARHHHV